MRTYPEALDTSVTRDHFHNIVKGRALCADGKVRSLKHIGYADTFFSCPASVTVKGKTVSGYITWQTVSGLSTPSEDDPTVLRFIANTYGKNGYLLPNPNPNRPLSGGF